MTEKIEINYVSPNEILVGGNKVFLLEGNIIYVVALGVQTSEMANAHLDLYLKNFSQMEGPVHFLIDLNKAGKNSPEARQIWKQHSDMGKTGKIALFGMHPVARVLASFATGVFKRGNVGFFETREEAMDWLKK